MAKNGGTHNLLLGVAIGAGALFLWEHFKGLSISVSNPPKSAPAASYVGILPGQTLPFWDDLDDTYVQSEVWDRRTSKYRNDGVIYNTVPRGGSALGLSAVSDWDPNKGLQIAGAYGNSLERDERTRQQHAGGSYPECKRIAGEFSC